VIALMKGHFGIEDRVGSGSRRGRRGIGSAAGIEQRRERDLPARGARRRSAPP
jgi:hypothetical protein